MKKTIYCLLAFLCPVFNLLGKPSPIVKAAKIGDTLTDVRLRNVVNYKSENIMLSDFKGRYILVDFFATTCGSCVMALPRLDSLQREYGDGIQIVVVTSDPKEKIELFLKKYRFKKSISLPFVTSDSILCKIFPHRMIPHEVWLDGNFRVNSITHGWEITRENIHKMLSDPFFRYPLKNDFMGFDRSRPLLENGNGGENSNILYRSTVTGYLDGLGSNAGLVRDTQTNSQRLFFINFRITDLYTNAIGISLPKNRTVLDVMDSSRFNGVNEFKTVGATYCYEQISPLSITMAERNKGMVQDLNRFFALNGRVEERMVRCYAIVKSPLEDKPYKPVATAGGTASKANIQTFMTVSELVKLLNVNRMHLEPAPIFLDETCDQKYLVPLFDSLAGGIGALKKQLEDNGLDTIVTDRLLQMLVISDH